MTDSSKTKVKQKWVKPKLAKVGKDLTGIESNLADNTDGGTGAAAGTS